MTEALSHYADWQKNQDKYNLCICVRDKMFALLYQANTLPEKNDDKSVINEDKGLSWNVCERNHFIFYIANQR